MNYGFSLFRQERSRKDAFYAHYHRDTWTVHNQRFLFLSFLHDILILTIYTFMYRGLYIWFYFIAFLESTFYVVVFLYAVYINNWHFYPKRVDFLMRGTVKLFLHISFIEFVVVVLSHLEWKQLKVIVPIKRINHIKATVCISITLTAPNPLLTSE